MKTPLTAYLAAHAEPEVTSALAFLNTHQPSGFERTVTIPLYAEYQNLAPLLDSLEKAALASRKKHIAILVINARLDAPEIDIEDNFKCLNFLGAQAKIPFHFKEGAHLCYLIINRSAPGFFFQPKEGVGLARKIAADIATALFERGQIHSPYIKCTDGDAVVAGDYFEDEHLQFSNALIKKRPAAYIHPFIHDTSDTAPQTDCVVQVYECFLKYYERGLKYAESPYAFQTIGSTLSIHAEDYAKVRGFPKKLAGEDFYLLNKLKKVGPIVSLPRSKIKLSGRASHRVPFGTGASVIKWTELQRNNEAITFYDPKIFYHLRLWLKSLENYALHGDAETFESEIKTYSLPSYNFAKSNLLFDQLKRITALSASSEVRKKHYSIFFDAFYTLKFVHALRDESFRSLDWREAVSNLNEQMLT